MLLTFGVNFLGRKSQAKVSMRSKIQDGMPLADKKQNAVRHNCQSEIFHLL